MRALSWVILIPLILTNSSTVKRLDVPLDEHTQGFSVFQFTGQANQSQCIVNKKFNGGINEAFARIDLALDHDCEGEVTHTFDIKKELIQTYEGDQNKAYSIVQFDPVLHIFNGKSNFNRIDITLDQKFNISNQCQIFRFVSQNNYSTEFLENQHINIANLTFQKPNLLVSDTLNVEISLFQSKLFFQLSSDDKSIECFPHINRIRFYQALQFNKSNRQSKKCEADQTILPTQQLTPIINITKVEVTTPSQSSESSDCKNSNHVYYTPADGPFWTRLDLLSDNLLSIIKTEPQNCSVDLEYELDMGILTVSRHLDSIDLYSLPQSVIELSKSYIIRVHPDHDDKHVKLAELEFDDNVKNDGIGALINKLVGLNDGDSKASLHLHLRKTFSGSAVVIDVPSDVANNDVVSDVDDKAEINSVSALTQFELHWKSSPVCELGRSSEITVCDDMRSCLEEMDGYPSDCHAVLKAKAMIKDWPEIICEERVAVIQFGAGVFNNGTNLIVSGIALPHLLLPTVTNSVDRCSMPSEKNTMDFVKTDAVELTKDQFRIAIRWDDDEQKILEGLNWTIQVAELSGRLSHNTEKQGISGLVKSRYRIKSDCEALLINQSYDNNTKLNHFLNAETLNFIPAENCDGILSHFVIIDPTHCDQNTYGFQLNEDLGKRMSIEKLRFFGLTESKSEIHVWIHKDQDICNQTLSDPTERGKLNPDGTYIRQSNRLQSGTNWIVRLVGESHEVVRDPTSIRIEIIGTKKLSGIAKHKALPRELLRDNRFQILGRGDRPKNATNLEVELKKLRLSNHSTSFVKRIRHVISVSSANKTRCEEKMESSNLTAVIQIGPESLLPSPSNTIIDQIKMKVGEIDCKRISIAFAEGVEREEDRCVVDTNHNHEFHSILTPSKSSDGWLTISLEDKNEEARSWVLPRLIFRFESESFEACNVTVQEIEVYVHNDVRGRVPVSKVETQALTGLDNRIAGFMAEDVDLISADLKDLMSKERKLQGSLVVTKAPGGYFGICGKVMEVPEDQELEVYIAKLNLETLPHNCKVRLKHVIVKAEDEDMCQQNGNGFGLYLSPGTISSQFGTELEGEIEIILIDADQQNTFVEVLGLPDFPDLTLKDFCTISLQSSAVSPGWIETIIHGHLSKTNPTTAFDPSRSISLQKLPLMFFKFHNEQIALIDYLVGIKLTAVTSVYGLKPLADDIILPKHFSYSHVRYEFHTGADCRLTAKNKVAKDDIAGTLKYLEHSTSEECDGVVYAETSPLGLCTEFPGAYAQIKHIQANQALFITGVRMQVKDPSLCENKVIVFKEVAPLKNPNEGCNLLNDPNEGYTIDLPPQNLSSFPIPGKFIIFGESVARMVMSIEDKRSAKLDITKQQPCWPTEIRVQIGFDWVGGTPSSLYFSFLVLSSTIITLLII